MPHFITCPKYEPVPFYKRCVHYLQNGACARPDEFMSIEWLKLNAPEKKTADTPVPWLSAELPGEKR